jgi:hypothetical protein
MIQQMFPATQAPTPEPHTGPRLILLLRCAHCPPTQASTVLCTCCGEPLQSPLDAPYDATASAILDWVIAMHDQRCGQQTGQEVTL